MNFIETKFKGAFVVEIEKLQDERGFFARAWCEKEFEEQGLSWRMVQGNISRSNKRGVVRGLHYQLSPYEEAKVVRCTRGAIFDVMIDLRQGSDTYSQWLGMELTHHSYKMLYVPEGFAHGYQILEDDTELFYLVSQPYSPEYERGVRWNDPMFQIRWPITDGVIVSGKDRKWPDYRT